MGRRRLFLYVGVGIGGREVWERTRSEKRLYRVERDGINIWVDRIVIGETNKVRTVRLG